MDGRQLMPKVHYHGTVRGREREWEPKKKREIETWHTESK